MLGRKDRTSAAHGLTLAYATYLAERLLLSSSLGPEVVSVALSALLGSQGICRTAIAADGLVQQVVLSKSALLDISNRHVYDLMRDRRTSL